MGEVVGTSEAAKEVSKACQVTLPLPGAGYPQLWNLWGRRRGRIRVSGGIGVVPSLQTAGFDEWVGMLRASGAIYPVCIGSGRILGQNDWFYKG